MKLYHTILSLTLVFAFSCDRLLEVEPEGNISGDALNDEKSIQQSLTGAYYNLAGIHDGSSGGELLGGDFIMIPTLLAHFGGSGVREIGWESTDAPQYSVFVDNRKIPGINERVNANWLRAYETISAVNTVLANVRKISNTTQRNRIEGEALGIRGLLYFEMVRLWAPQYSEETLNTPALPLLLDPVLSVSDLQSIERSSVQQVYERAQEDLETASVLLQPFGKNATGISYYACQAYLTRLFMHKGTYEAAWSAANNIINTDLYALTPTPMDAFNNPSNSSEDILAIQQSLSNNTGDRSSGMGLTAFYSSLAESGLGTFHIYQASLYESPDPDLTGFYGNNPAFSSSDLRSNTDLSVTINTPTSSITSAFYPSLINKQEGLLSSAKYLSANHVIPVIRLAEVLLNRAESIFETNPSVIDPIALSDLNQVRERSGLTALSEGHFNGDPAAFYDSIVIEKKRELLFEGSLLHDLKRRRSQKNDNDIFIGTLLNKIDPTALELVLPVPQAETDANNN